MFNLKIPTFESKTTLPDSYTLGDYTLPLVASARRKSIAVKQRNGNLVLEVPKAISAKQLSRVLSQNHNWLVKRLTTLVENIQPKFTAQHNEEFMLFGQTYCIQWLTSNEGNQPKFCLDNNNNQALFHFCEQKEASQKQAYCFKALEQWMKGRAYEYLLPKLDFYAEQIGVSYKSLTVKGYKSRWGSCYSDGRIQFNWRLMQAPEWVIDYVVVHELVHLIHANHSKAFWDLVEKHYPKTKQAKQVMKQNGRNWIEFLQK
ncbi:MAG TPA: M48 family peptidase [Thiomicrospira sp.]|jgi:predicted metal-dependent hydrolase|nr:M48 family peptidase [Thiomicrospira sp.]